MGYAIRTQTHRMVEWRDFGSGSVSGRELYDHRRDPSETVNLARSAPADLIDRLTGELLSAHPRVALTMTPAVHSNPNRNRLRADLGFANRSTSDVMVYPITPQGRRGRARHLPPGQELTIGGRIGGVYVVESKDGTIHQTPFTLDAAANRDPQAQSGLVPHQA